MNIQSKLKKRFPDLVGDLKVRKFSNTILVSGDVSVSDEEEFMSELSEVIYEENPNSLSSIDVNVNDFRVIEDTIQNDKNKVGELDEVDILYYGYLNVNHIKPNDEFKMIHENNREKLDNCVRVLEFIAPIVLDSDLKVIDGNFRLQLAQANDIDKVLVVVIDDNETKADFLRLALNRTSEFQRWNYREIDNYVDNTPQAQPILEPIGFFGKYVLPESFFSNTVVKYSIDPFNEKQKQYSQEAGLDEWARYRREKMAKLSKEKRAKKPKNNENAVSLFDLAPKEDDFLETYDIDEEMEKFVDKYKEIAGEITDYVDAKKKAEIEEKGGVWQHTHRSSKEVAKSRRQEAIDSIQSTDILSEDEKDYAIDNINEYAEYTGDIEKLAKVLRGEE